MKPIRLELRGFTAFRERTVVEFEGRHLFAITGPTGAGKSSLLDAMTWALYGQVPRVGSSTRQLVSHGATSMQVRFDFSTRDGVYRVVRKAPAVTGTRLEQRQADGSWRHLADRSRDVTAEVVRLLGMDFKTFTRTVLLPQGEFDAFLKGDQSERRAILSSLLGLGVYDDARKIASDRAKRARERSATVEAQLAQLNLASPERIAALEVDHAAAQQQLCLLNERRDTLRGLGDLARTARDAGRAHADATAASEAAATVQAAATTALTSATAAVERAEHRCDALSRERTNLAYDPARHQALRGQVERLKLREAADRELTEAKQKLEAARTAHSAAIATAASAAGLLAEAETAASTTTEALQRASEQLAAAAGGAALALSDLEARAATAAADLEAAKADREALATQLPRIEAVAKQLAERASSHALAAAEAKRAFEERDRTGKAAASVEQQLAGAGTRLESAQATLAEARHADLAATLRSGLKPGDRCPVCGDRITQIPMAFGAADLAAAEAAVHEAERLLEEARRASSDARTAAATATARAESATTTLASADALLAAIDEELAQLDSSRDELPATLDQRRGALDAAQQRETIAGQSAAALTSQHGALKLALAAIPEEIAPVATTEACPNPAAVNAALAAWRPVRTGATDAAQKLQQARAEHARFEQQIAAAGAHAEAAEEAARQAEQRLAAHGDAPAGTEASALREALTVADQAAKRAEELDAQISVAKAAIAAAIATRAAAETDRTRALEAATATTQLLTSTQAVATAERAILDAAWREEIGAEPEPGFESLRQLMLVHEADQQAAAIKAGVLGEQIAQSKREVIEAERMRNEIAGDKATADLHGALARELQGDRFVGYVQREAMQLLSADASFRLIGFTNGRYELAAEDNEFVVVDRLNGDERRSVKTLSGGETFLASLALALSLSEHLPQLAGLGGAVSLQSLFLDEGFGALDRDSLDLAVQGLETIASSQRMIGVISHVEEMAERLPERIEVVKQGNSSIVRG
ncbi:MAG: SMC family ATPase [Chloroflexi bacterium]|nr:SMC family ATPase [Chloroflexota bacterium]MDA1145866.1 SMC family ATPase [Chloroflexota bacterium]